MTLILNVFDLDELNEQATVTCPDNLILDDFERLCGVTALLGQGYNRTVDLLPGVWLSFLDEQYHQDFIEKAPVHPHPIQIIVFLSGLIHFDDVYPTLGGDRSYFSGSGMSHATAGMYRAGRHSCVNIEIDPDLFYSSFLTEEQREDEGIKQLFKGEEWKASVYPKVTPQMRSLALQMWNTPYRGAAKRMYLQGKVFELLAIYLDLIAEDGARHQAIPSLKPETIERLHHARKILSTQFAHPPSLLELAQQVGLSERSLQRGFQALFNTTVIGYLKQEQLQQAERLLRRGNCTVAEVAMQVGYGHLGRFATAFRQQFGITPSQCLVGKRLIHSNPSLTG
jgi:AraC-like DNA-binding protein